MNHDINDKKVKSNIKGILFIGLLVLVILYFAEFINILKNVYKVMYPLLLGAGIAYVLNILVSKFEKMYFQESKNKMIIRTRKGVSILLAVLTVALILFFFLQILIPRLNELIQLILSAVPILYNKIAYWLEEYSDELPLLQQNLKDLNMDAQAALKKGSQILSSWAGGTMSFVGSLFGTIFNVVLAFIFSIYILFEKDDLKYKLEKLLKVFVKEERRNKLYYVMRTADESFSSFIVGQCKEAVILGLLCTFGMMIFKFPYAGVIGPVIGLTALIPMVGAYLGATIGFLLIVIIDPIKAFLFLVFIVILQQLEGNIIYPKVVGKSMGLPGIWVFVAIIMGGGLMGIGGIIFGVPLAATIYKILSDVVQNRTDHKNIEARK